MYQVQNKNYPIESLVADARSVECFIIYYKFIVAPEKVPHFPFNGDYLALIIRSCQHLRNCSEY